MARGKGMRDQSSIITMQKDKRADASHFRDRNARGHRMSMVA